jgi:hypothetical protein
MLFSGVPGHHEQSFEIADGSLRMKTIYKRISAWAELAAVDAGVSAAVGIGGGLWARFEGNHLANSFASVSAFQTSSMGASIASSLSTRRSFLVLRLVLVRS